MCLKIAVSLVLLIHSVAGKSASCSSSEPDTPMADSGECLLASGSRVSRALSKSSSRLGVTVSAGVHRAWLTQHERLRKAAKESTSILDKFIADQGKSKDACSARLMESKRILDGLLKDVSAISEQVKSHEELLSTETTNLGITKQAIEAAETIYNEQIEECDKLKDAALGDVDMYSDELKELDQIANPALRYEQTIIVSLPEKDENFSIADERNHTALLEQGVFSMSSCKAFKEFSLHSKVSSVASAANLTCDEQREQLQKVFEETYIAVTNLLNDAKKRAEDKLCYEEAETQKATAMVPLTSQREQAASRIEYSNSALVMLEPVLNLLKDRVQKLQEHINDTLTPECADATKVSETLQVVRELIISLEECPGRNDFKLKIPEIPGAEGTPGQTTVNHWSIVHARPSEDTAPKASELQKVAVESSAKETKRMASTNLPSETVAVKSSTTEKTSQLATSEARATQPAAAKATHSDKPPAQTIAVRADAKTGVSTLKTATTHRHRHHKHGHDHGHSEVQDHGEIHQIDGEHNAEVKDTTQKEHDEVHHSSDERDSDVNDTKQKETEKKKDGSISITVESTSV